MSEGLDNGAIRYAISIAILVVTVALLGLAALTFLPHTSETAGVQLRTLKDLAFAYTRVQPGTTRASQLAALGFDAAGGNVQALSYLGVIERFASDSRGFDSLDEALQTCIEARDRCTAYVFTPTDAQHGDGMFEQLGLGAAHAASRDAQVTLLVQDGRVAYKTITGVPQTLLARRDPEAVATPAVTRRVTALPAAERIVAY
jgi:hypothetical protein